MADALFNADSVGQLAAEYAAAVPGFDAARFSGAALAGFADRALLARLDWLADCLSAQLDPEFPRMADQMQAAMPAVLNPDARDDDFGRFIHAVPGILAVRYGLEDHPERALELIYDATKRFSMEFYIRPFINRWPDRTVARLTAWAQDENYHVRRLVSEGTRPRLPWAKNITMTSEARVPLLQALHADRTRYVTRSVANHLNDLSKEDPDLVVSLLAEWQRERRQAPKELDWMRRHGLRTLVKQGHAPAMAALGYHRDAQVSVTASVAASVVAMGDAVVFDVTVTAATETPVLVDYRIRFARPGGKSAEKVFKLRQGVVHQCAPYTVRKAHKLKAGASTFALHPGPHRITVQVNGCDHAVLDFDLTG